MHPARHPQMKPPRGSTINRQHPLAQGLVGCWLMNENGGLTAYDLSGYGNHGTLTNGPTWEAGKDGPALGFDGANDYVDAGNRDSLGIATNLTITLRSKFIGTIGTNYDFIICKKNSIYTQSTGFLVYYSAYNSGTIDIIAGDSYFKRHTQLQDHDWHHYAIVYNGTMLTLYQDSVELSGSYNNSPSVVKAGTDNLWIGKRDVAYEDFSKTVIDNVLIYNRALSAAEIQRLNSDPYCFMQQPRRARWFVVPGGASYFKVLSDSLSLADGLQKGMSKPLTESLGFIDAVPKAGSKSLSELLNEVDSIIKATSITESADATLSDNLNRGTQKAVSETLLENDALSKDVGKTAIDEVLLSDAISRVNTKSFSNAISAIDAISKDSAKSLLDIISAIDAITEIQGKFLTDSITLSDTLGKAATKTLLDNLSVSDSFSRTVAIARLLAASITLLDALKRDASKDFSEIVEILSSAQVVFGKLLSETLILTDAVERQAAFRRAFTEVLSNIDSLAKAISVVCQENISLTDASVLLKSLIVFAELAKLLAELSISDTVLAKETISDTLEAKS